MPRSKDIALLTLLGLACWAKAASDDIPNDSVAKRGPSEVSSQGSLEVSDEILTGSVYTDMFKFGPAINSLIAATLISGVPTLLLVIAPANLTGYKLIILVSFALGGLLGTIFLHLLPSVFLGGDGHSDELLIVETDSFTVTVLGASVFIGFMVFFVIDKTLRIVQSEGAAESEELKPEPTKTVKVKSSGSEKSATKATKRKNKKDKVEEKAVDEGHSHSHGHSHSSKTSAYLNTLSDFAHSISESLALTSTFYLSAREGASICLLLLVHEIPHQIGDYALMMQGGFTRKQAITSQIVVASGTYLGTLLGIALQYSSKNNSWDPDMASASTAVGILGSSIQWAHVTIPFTTGNFLYIAYSVLSELLEVDPAAPQKESVKQFLVQLTFIGLGFSSVLYLD